jgi:hypothetical protein
LVLITRRDPPALLRGSTLTTGVAKSVTSRRLAQAVRDRGVADVDHDRLAVVAHVGGRAGAVEAQDDAAGAVVTAAEVDVGHVQRGAARLVGSETLIGLTPASCGLRRPP